jgi:hypothetical protein
MTIAITADAFKILDRTCVGQAGFAAGVPG